MNSRITVSLVVPIVQIALFWLMSEADCMLRECIEDDASRRAEAIFGPIILVLYYILSVLIVHFSTSFSLKVNRVGASALLPVIVSCLFSWALYSPKVDTIAGMAKFFAFISVPWVFACLAASTIMFRDRANA